MLENLHKHTNPNLQKPCQETHAVSEDLIEVPSLAKNNPSLERISCSCLMDYTGKKVGEMRVCVLDF